jgi:flagellar hook-basal body complex protein FliE
MMVDGVGMNPAGPIGPLGPGSLKKAEGFEGDRAFSDILKDSIENVNRLQSEADVMLEKYTKGEVNQDQVTAAFKKSQIAFDALLQIRNKLVEAFEDVQRMRI